MDIGQKTICLRPLSRKSRSARARHRSGHKLPKVDQCFPALQSVYAFVRRRTDRGPNNQLHALSIRDISSICSSTVRRRPGTDLPRLLGWDITLHPYPNSHRPSSFVPHPPSCLLISRTPKEPSGLRPEAYRPPKTRTVVRIRHGCEPGHMPPSDARCLRERKQRDAV